MSDILKQHAVAKDVKNIDKAPWTTEAQNKLAKDIANTTKKELHGPDTKLPMRIVQGNDTIGAIAIAFEKVGLINFKWDMPINIKHANGICEETTLDKMKEFILKKGDVVMVINGTLECNIGGLQQPKETEIFA